MTKLLLVGCGKMGGALLNGFLKRGLKPADIVVVTPPSDLGANFETLFVADPGAIPADFVPDAILLAVKPQMMDEVAPLYRKYADKAVYLSVAAGKPIRYFQKIFGDDAAIVRTMPNTPAAIQRGVTGMVASSAASLAQKVACQKLMEAVGDVVWVDDESLIDALSALSGSGPAYVFLLVEALASAGVDSGLPADLAMTLARATVIGSAGLLDQSGEDAAQLRADVTSPKGTTLAALNVLMDEENGLGPLFSKALAAAIRRSRELAG